MSRQLLVHGGPILTMDPLHQVVEAVLCQDGLVTATGTFDDVRDRLSGPYDDIDLRGRLATPGLNDAHAHVDLTGFALEELALAPPAVASIADIRHLVAQRADATPPGTWIVGQGYDQASLDERRHPTRHDLDDIAPHHPVLLWRSCQHVAVANSVALQLSGISAETGDTSDGTIDRDDGGEPTGVVRESMSKRVGNARPPRTEEDYIAAIAAGAREFRRFGVTSVTDAIVGRPEQVRAYQALWRRGELPVRIRMMLLIDEMLPHLQALGVQSGFGDDWLAIGPVKLFADGSIGGRTARLRSPYRDDPGNLGLWMIEPHEIRKKVLRAHRAGYQVGIHAIGDAAIEAVIDAYAAAQQDSPRPDARHRIEHCSLPDERMVERIRELGIVPIPGTSFLYYTRPAYLANLGEERLRYAYAMRTYATMGIVAAASTDAPIVPVDPLIGIQTMVTRRDRLGNTLYPEEGISVEEALKAYTWNAAWATHDEARKGMLRPGYLADLTIFDADLRAVDPATITARRVDYTVIAGEVVHDSTG